MPQMLVTPSRLFTNLGVFCVFLYWIWCARSGDERKAENHSFQLRFRTVGTYNVSAFGGAAWGPAPALQTTVPDFIHRIASSCCMDPVMRRQQKKTDY